MIHDSQDIEIVFSEHGALVAGPDGAVAALLARLDLPATSVESAAQSAKDLFAGLTGVAGVASAFDPRWMRMTSESYARLQELGGFEKDAQGLISGVLRGDKGRIDQFLKFNAGGGVNPLVASNVAALAATMALRSAIAQLQSLVESMDVKLDVLLEDNRTAAIGDVQGLTTVLSRAYRLYERTGRISETVWSEIAGHSSALSQAEATARNHVDSLAVSVGMGSFSARADEVHRVAEGELQHWLVILAAVRANLQRLDVLKLAHLRERDPEAVPAHAEEARDSLEEGHRLLTQSIQRLSDALANTAAISDASRVRNPLRSRKLIQEVEQSLKIVSAFAEITDIGVTVEGQLEREPWRKSLADLAKGTAADVRAVATAVPREVTRRREDTLLQKATKIQERRAFKNGPDVTEPATGQSED